MKSEKKEQQNRRNFLKSSVALSALSFLAPSTSFAAEQVEESDFTFLSEPILQTSFNHSMSVIWLVSKQASNWVEYGTSPDQLNQKAYAKSALGLRPIGTVNVIKLVNLQANTRYYYRAVSKEILDFKPYKLTYGKVISSEIQSFVCIDPKKENIDFVMLNDTHDRPASIGKLLSLNHEVKPDFVFFNGDIFDYQTNEQQIIDHFLKPCAASFAKNTPFVYVRGNHETRGKFCREFVNYFEQVAYQAFSLGPARFVVLDTGEDKEDSHPVYAGIVDFDAYREEQAAWLAKEIESKEFKKAKFRIVMMHIPPRYSGDWHGSLHCTQLFEPLLNKGKVDLVLSGHTHEYKVHAPAKGLNAYPLIIGGGPKEGTRTLTTVKLSSKNLQVRLIRDDGEEVGRYDINR
jgi:predicted phosphodiesterase